MSTNTTTLNPHKQGFAKTIGQGFSTIGGSSSVFYTLFYLDNTISKQAGQHDTIVVNEIFLGRDRDCLVRYDELKPTVSRKHAVIRWENGVVVLHHLSKTNSTYINDQEVFGQRPLQNGDVIKLSSDGPRMRFNIAESGQGLKGMRMTERLSLFAKQGLRPYRNAIILLSTLLLIVTSFASYYAIKANNQMEVIENKQKEMDSLSIKVKLAEKELNKLELQSGTDTNRILELKSQIRNYKREVDILITEIDQKVKSIDVSETSPVNAKIQILNSVSTTTEESNNAKSSYDSALEELENDIYYVHVERIEIVNSKGQNAEVKLDALGEFWGGTGFIDTEGDFITARHVVQPWKYFNPGGNLATGLTGACSLSHLLSICEFNNISFIVYYKAISKSGKNFTFTDKDCVTNASQDFISKTDITFNDCDKKLVDFAKGIFNTDLKHNSEFRSAKRGYTDWAIIQMRTNPSKIEISRTLVQNKGETLYTLGYPLLSYIQENFDKSKLEPAYGTMVVSQAGSKNNVTHVTNHSFTGGNSGGPVFVKRNGKYICIGLVSASTDGIGFVVPCANIR
ncbi:MAG: FHA domain-containing protein [Saprospiraceae bacterium]